MSSAFTLPQEIALRSVPALADDNSSGTMKFGIILNMQTVSVKNITITFTRDTTVNSTPHTISIILMLFKIILFLIFLLIIRGRRVCNHYYPGQSTRSFLLHVLKS